MSENLEERVERIEEELGIELNDEEDFVLRADATGHGGIRYFVIDEDLEIFTENYRSDWINASVKGNMVGDEHKTHWNVVDLSLVPRSEAPE